MALSEHEKALLDGIGTRLRRDDPGLARRLSCSAPSAAGGWRPPKVAIVIALVLVAGASALVGGVTLAMTRPCTVAAVQVVSARPDPARTAPPATVPPAGPRNC